MKMRRLLAVLLAISMVLVLAGCGAAADMKVEATYSTSVEAPMMPADGIYTDSVDVSLPENQKWIRTIYLNAETQEMDALLETVNQQVAELGGYVENRDIYHGSSYANYGSRNANLVVRIPVDRVDAFVTQVSGASNVTSTSETVENITLNYVATESRIKALETEQTRLLELLAQAENMSDLLEIEARLTDVRYELENYTSQLRLYDNLVDYATVHLNVREVQVLTPQAEDSMWTRIAGGFMENLRGLGTFLVDFVVWLLSSLPWLVPVAGIIAGGIWLIRKRPKKKIPRPTQDAE